MARHPNIGKKPDFKPSLLASALFPLLLAPGVQGTVGGYGYLGRSARGAADLDPYPHRLATYTVTTANDEAAGSTDLTTETNDGAGLSLREAIAVASAAAHADGTDTVDVTDDDTAELSIDDVTVAEGGLAQFTVTFSSPSTQTVTVEAASADGSALAGSDYTSLGTTTFTSNPGDTTQTVEVQTTNDSLEENAETFTVDFGNPVNAAITVGSGTGTIPANDDDGVDNEDLVPDPNGVTFGDGNGDGILDSTQGNVVSLRTAYGAYWATLFAPDGQILTDIQPLPVPAGAPLGIVFPYGVFSFNLESSVGRGGVYACGGAGQGATTRNSPLLQGVVTQPCAAASVQSAP